jgi:hypothetical protein
MGAVIDGPCSRPLAGLAMLLAACPTFQAKLDVMNADLALPLVYLGKVDFSKAPIPTRPYAIVTDDDQCSWELDQFFKSAGQVILTFEFPSHPDYDPDSGDALIDYTTAVGLILVEMFERTNTPAPDGTQYWHATKATRLVAPALCDERKFAGDNEPGELFFESSFLIDWM